MTNKKTTLRALLLSAISVIACIAMLTGTTFAWFTDSVSSMNNIIKSGNLDLVVEYKTNWSDTWAELDENTKLFSEENLYEPGYTEVVFLRVANAGSLALKYQLAANIVSEKSSTNVYGEKFKLSDYLQIGAYTMAEFDSGFNYADILFPILFGTREDARNSVNSANGSGFTKLSAFSGIAAKDVPVLPGDTTSQVTALVLYMPEEVDNVANHKTGEPAPEITFGLNVLATQLVSEEDSFGPDYDKDATYPTVVNTAAELVDALTSGEEIVLAGDIDLADTSLAIPASTDAVINLNGKTLSATTQNASTAKLINVPASSSLTISNGTVEFKAEPDTSWGNPGQPAFPAYATNTINLSGKLVVENATIVNNTPVGGASYAIDCYPGADLTINDGAVIDGNGNVAIRTFANSATTPINITVNGGVITGRRAFWIQLPSNNASIAPDVNLTVNGGELTSTDTGVGGYNLAIYSYSYGNDASGVDVVFNGGIINGNVAFGGGSKVGAENVTVNGGTFNGDLGRYTDTAEGWVDIAKP